MENYKPSPARYDAMKYRRCGRSGLLLPEISLGFWHNFGAGSDSDNCRRIVEYAFDHGITHFDLANNYGPPCGAAEERFGEIFAASLRAHRDEIVVATKAGYASWPGPYGEWGSRKAMTASLDRSLKRLGLDYVDIFYSHRPDPGTPLEETMQALADIVRQGKALYAGISKYPPEMAAEAYSYLHAQHVPCLVYQGRYNMIDRSIEEDIIPQAAAEGAGFVAFSPLAQGLLTGKYLHGVPDGSRMSRNDSLKRETLTPELLARISGWNDEAAARGLTLAQYALRWVLRRPEVTSVIVGVSSVEQLKSNLAALDG